MNDFVTITNIIPVKKMLELYSDGVYLGRIGSEQAFAYSICEGRGIEKETLQSLFEESERTTAFKQLLSILSRKAKTIAEAKKKLEECELSKSAVMYAIDKACEYGYLDDVTYANDYITSKKMQFGRRRIEYELRKKGISQDIIETAIEEKLPVEDNSDAALTMARATVRGAKEMDEKLKNKVMRKLISRGFEYDEVISAVARIEREMNGEYDA